jgi:hypothetical protein
MEGANLCFHITVYYQAMPNKAHCLIRYNLAPHILRNILDEPSKETP